MNTHLQRVEIPFFDRISTRLSRLVFAPACLSLCVPAAVPAADSPTILTNIEQVQLLGNQSTPTNRYQAQFRATVTYPSLPTRRLYLQDGDFAIQANLIGSVAAYKPGHVVEVTGTVVRGLPYARIFNAQARIIEEGPIPIPKPTTMARVLGGEDPFLFVSLRAFIRDMVADRNGLTLVATEEGNTCEIVIPAQNATLPREWLDGEIEVQGIAYPFFSDRNQPTYARIHSPSLSFIRPIKPGITNLFDRPTMTIADAGRQKWDWQKRIKVAGIVTVQQPAETLFIEDATGPMKLNLLFLEPKYEETQGLEHDEPTWFQPGDRVEVIGVRHGPYSLTPTLRHAEVRRVAKEEPPAPHSAIVRDLLAGRFAGRVVSIQGKLLDQKHWRIYASRRLTLTLQSDEQIVQATWESELPAKWDLKPGSYVRVTGVNDATRGSPGDACTFQILLRSPADVVTTAPPPFWKHAEFHRILVAAGIVGLVASAFILFQRLHMRRLEVRVAVRTGELREMNSQLQNEVTARERAQAELRIALESEKELGELRNTFVSMVSHQFRTPLGAILSSAEILEHYHDKVGSEKRQKHLETIQNAVQRMSGLVDEVLLFNRSQSGRMDFRPAPLDLLTLCRQLIDEVHSATSRRCPILFEPNGTPAHVRGDERLLRHVLTNVLDNAVKYSPAGSNVSLALARNGDNAVFTVRDSGAGIPAADKAKLFTPFHRGRNVSGTPGTGLGMVIVKRCVERHGGRLAVESVEGAGTTVIIHIPLFGEPSVTTSDTFFFAKNAA